MGGVIPDPNGHELAGDYDLDAPGMIAGLG